MNEQMRETIQQALRSVLPSYPVDVRVSPEDDRVLWVMVFAVPDVKIQEVEDIVLDLEQERFANSSLVFLPMVKSVAVTREHYPEHLPPEQTVSTWSDTCLRGANPSVFASTEWYTRQSVVPANNELALAA